MIWLVVSALGIAAGVAVLWRLRLAPPSVHTAVSARDYDLEIYRDQLRELENDLSRGVVEAADAEAARNEIRRRALMVAQAAEHASPADAADGRPLSRSTVWILAASVPVLSIALYALLGRPDLADRTHLTVQEQKRGPTRADIRAAGRMTPAQRRAMIRGMVDRLAARLKDNPKDLAGWLRLGRARSVLEQHQAAAAAYGRAAALAPKNVRVLTLYAMAVLRTQKDETLAPGVVALMKRLYDLEPRHPLALYYLGKNAFDLGDDETGRNYWRRLLPLIKDRPKFAEKIRRRLAQGGGDGRK